jgi:hypothetical protein
MPHPRCAACDRRRECAGTLYPRWPCLCAAFVGTANSKACPRSYFQVKTEEACQNLAAIADKPYIGSVNVSASPSGCFWLAVGGGVYLNTNTAGTANLNAQQLCAGAPYARTAVACMGRNHQRHAHAHTHSHTSDLQ